MSQKVQDSLAPATYTERGVIVSFTTPLLSQARMRRDRNRNFEVVMPGFTGGKGHYVMPWKTLSSTMTVTLHDRLLFDAISELPDHLPEAVRRTTFQVAAGGVAGPDAAARAVHVLTDDAQHQMLLHYHVVVELLRASGTDASDLLAASTSSERRKLAQQALDRIAAANKIHSEQLYERVEALSQAAAPVGLPACPQPGRLRMLCVRLAAFHTQLQQWGADNPSELDPLIAFIVAHARYILDRTTDRLQQFDQVGTDVKRLITDTKRLNTVLVPEAVRVSWLLDGWDFIISMWTAVQSKPPEAISAAIAEIFRLTPPIPKEETAKPPSYDIQSLAKIHRRWTTSGEEWRTGALDMEAVMRIEALKAMAA